MFIGDIGGPIAAVPEIGSVDGYRSTFAATSDRVLFAGDVCPVPGVCELSIDGAVRMLWEREFWLDYQTEGPRCEDWDTRLVVGETAMLVREQDGTTHRLGLDGSDPQTLPISDVADVCGSTDAMLSIHADGALSVIDLATGGTRSVDLEPGWRLGGVYARPRRLW